jgi:hypothetical protein
MNAGTHPALERRPRTLPFALGFAIALVAVLALGEAYAWLYPPSSVRENAGAAAQRGLYKADPDLGADYRSFAEFHSENAQRLNELGALDAAVPTWLFLGNSFVQAPGMLGDTAVRALPDKRIFHLRRNVELPLRAAQTRLLLRQGLRPQRIFFVLLPIDLLQIGARPLSFMEVDDRGALRTRIRWPDDPWRGLLQASQLATTVWLRTSSSKGDPSFRPQHVSGRPSPRVKDDLRRILHVLALTSRRHGVPVTVMALPNREQVFGRASFGFQESLRELAGELGLDHYDARQPLARHPDKRALFLPDWHFNAHANELILAGLLEHLRAFHPGEVRASKAP